MGRLIPALAVMLFISTAAVAASGTITARLTDAAEGQDILGAVVEYSPTGKPDQKKYTTSGARGAISIPGLTYGDYNVAISFLGYANIERKVTVDKGLVALGTLKMEQASKRIDDVVLEVQAIRTSQKGDTVSYNADAFKVAKDADAEGLLAKLPGVRIVDGTVEAQGETVKKVFVDGKEFFGEDVNSAIKNLPAETIAKIEVYNKQSDQAEFTGVDDGEDYKAINIVTKEDMRQGQFGKLYAGYGFDDMYVAGGSVNVFSGSNRWSIIGLSNNMNQQNFSMEDILGVSGNSRSRYSRSRSRGGDFMVPQQAGISRVNSFGVNYSGEWGKKVTFSGSYFFNTNDNSNENRTDREYYPVDDPDVRRLYRSESYSHSTNFNNRLNGRLEWNINDNHSFMYRPSLSFQTNSSLSSQDEANSNGHFAEDGKFIDATPLNTISTDSKANSNGYYLSNFFLYRAKLGKPGRTISVDGSVSLSKNDRDGYSDALTHYYSSRPDSVRNQHRVNAANQQRYRINGMYTEPVSEHTSVNLQYRFSYNDEPSDRKVYMWDDALHAYEGEMDRLLSNIYSSIYLTNSIGPGFNYNNPKTVAVFNASYQSSMLAGDRTFPEPANELSTRFDNVVYFGMLNQTFSPNNTLRVFIRSDTDNPSVSQLQDVPDISNTQNVTSGNSRLKPSYEHNLYMNYNRSMVQKGRTLMVMLGASMENNYIADSLVQLSPGDPKYPIPGSDNVYLENSGQYTRPVNMNGYRSMRSMVSYGTPLPWIKCNFNINAGVDWGRTPSYINGLENISNTFNYHGGLVLSSNISENLDFTLRYSAGYNVVHNTINKRNDNDFWNQRAEGNVKWVFLGGFTFAANAAYSKYSNVSSDYKEEYCIANVMLGKKVLRNHRGEINVGLYDAFNQNRSYSRYFSAQYIRDSYNNVLGRYVGINLIYNLRNFGKRKPSKQADSSEREGMRFMGPPPGGGGSPM